MKTSLSNPELLISYRINGLFSSFKSNHTEITKDMKENQWFLCKNLRFICYTKKKMNEKRAGMFFFYRKKNRNAEKKTKG
jgi:hypothetical protein